MSTTTNTHISSNEVEILLETFPQGIFAVDLETTGLSPLVDKIIEISAIKVLPSGVTIFNELVNPEIPIPQNTIDIHGIKDDMVKDSEKIENILPNFLEFVGDTPSIAHNAQFDMGFLIFNIHSLKLEIPQSKSFCSCKLSRKVFKKFENHKLVTCATELGIGIENHHRALSDAIASLRIYARALIKMKEQNDADGQKYSFNFNMNDFDRSRSFEIPKHLIKLKEFVQGQTVIEIKYAGGTIKNRFRPVRPIGLLPLPRGDVLYGLCLSSNMLKSFLLSKIKDFRVVSKEM